LPAMQDDVTLPLPPVPSDPAEVLEWLELYRAYVEAKRLTVELHRFGSDLERIEADRAKAAAERVGCEFASEKMSLEMERLRIELAQLRRSEAAAVAQADNALVYTYFKAVDGESVAEAVATLDEWSRRHPGATIEVQLTSPGGYVLEGLALYDFLRTLSGRGHKIVVTVFGFAASMGAVLLQAGDERRIGANSYVMIHEVASGAYGKVADLEDKVEFSRRLQDRLIKILCTRSALTAPKVREMWRKRDVWLDAKEAKRLGLVDTIVS
jgi:ATP-dependent Clp endopeptidase proteolytic subunit ClpP